MGLWRSLFIIAYMKVLLNRITLHSSFINYICTTAWEAAYVVPHKSSAMAGKLLTDDQSVQRVLIPKIWPFDPFIFHWQHLGMIAYIPRPRGSIYTKISWIWIPTTTTTFCIYPIWICPIHTFLNTWNSPSNQPYVVWSNSQK